MALHGLFIGIDRFASPGVNWLNCAKRDAVALHGLFTDTLGAGCALLTDGQATLSAIQEHFEKLAKCDASDTVIISFSGHGTQTHELLAYDSDPTSFHRTAIPLSLLAEWFSRIPARQLICILDCCFSGGMGAKVFMSDVTPRSVESEAKLLDQLSGKGRLVLTASGASEPAWEINRYQHGLLTYHLLEALQGAPEVRQAGKISFYKLLEYVTQRVTDGAATFGKSQTPTLRGQLDGELTWPVFTAGATYHAAFPERKPATATAEILSLEAYGFPATLLKAWAGSIPSFNQLQLDAINEYGLLRGEHLVVSAPTSSGKTLIGELAALRGVLDRKRSIFLLPLKAIVNDKHRQFTETYREFGLRVIRATGEVADDIPDLMRGQYDICLMTYEKFAAIAAGSPHILEQVGTIIVDEVQMIADDSRGANLEFILTLLRMRRKLGVEPQLVALSAVIGDTNGLERWLGARLLRRDERPVPLDEGLLRANGSFRFIDADGNEQVTGPVVRPEYSGKNSSQDLIKPLVRKLVSEGKQAIVFRETKGEARGCASYLADALRLPPAQAALGALPVNDPSLASATLRDTLKHGVAFHVSDLDREERFVIEKHFRTPETPLRVIAATTTLAMGVNTPAEAVIIAGLEHPGNKPYSVAEYKNMVGRAGRLGYADRGTSYLIAMTPNDEHHFWNTYVKGIPEDVRSRFVDESTDPRTLILRVLAAAQRASIKGIPGEEIIEFLEGSFGAFQKKQEAANWNWSRESINESLRVLASHRLVDMTQERQCHLTELGRFTGESGIQVESVIRMVDAFSGVNAESINDPTLIAVAQLTVEVDELLFPLNKKSTQKEPQTWTAEVRRQGVPASILSLFNRNTRDQHQGTLRAKKTAGCLLWITGRPIAEIEKVMTQFGGAFGGAAGPIRSVSTRTADFLPAVAKVASVIHPSLELTDRVTRLVARLETGVSGEVAEIARRVGSRITRGEYQMLVQKGFVSPEAIDSASEGDLLQCLGADQEKVKILRAAARSIKEKIELPAFPILPEYAA